LFAQNYLTHLTITEKHQFKFQVTFQKVSQLPALVYFCFPTKISTLILRREKYCAELSEHKCTNSFGNHPKTKMKEFIQNTSTIKMRKKAETTAKG